MQIEGILYAFRMLNNYYRYTKIHKDVFEFPLPTGERAG